MLTKDEINVGKQELTGEDSEQKFQNMLDATSITSFYDQAFATTFSDKFEAAEDNERRWLGDNWSPEKKQKHAEQNRQSFSMPIITSKIRTISATMRDSTREYKVDASQDLNDEIKAELATLKLRHISNKSNAKYVDGEIFDSGLGVLYGASKVFIDYSGKYPAIRYKKLDYKSVIWDVNSKEYNVRDDALWMAEIEFMYRYQLKAMGVNPVDIPSGNTAYTTFAGRNTTSYYIQRDPNGNEAYDIITVFHHYQKAIRDIYCVTFSDVANLVTNADKYVYEEFESRKEAEQFLTKIMMVYLDNDIDLPVDELAEAIQSKQKTFIDTYDLVYNKILNYEETSLEMFPIDVFFSFRFEDKFISMMDFMKDPQIFLDRMWSQIDYSIGVDLKKVTEINESLLSERNPAGKAVEILKKGGYLFKKTGEKLLDQTEGSGVNPQTFQIANIMQSYLEDVAGGRSFQGLSESSSESGIAIQRKQAAGLMVAVLFLHNFSRYMKARGENLIHWVKKFDTIENTIRVQGSELTPEMMQLLQQNNIYVPSELGTGGYIKLNQPNNELSFLNNAEYELTVTETEPSDTRKAVKRQQMAEALQIMPELRAAPTFRQEYLSTFDFSNTNLQRMIQEADEVIAAQQQQEQRQNQINELQQLRGLTNEQRNNNQNRGK